MRRRALSLILLSLFLVGCAIMPNTSSSPTAGAGQVRVSTDRATYTPTDPVSVTVRNPLSTPIYALDTQATCSILSLEYQASGSWGPSQMAQCPQKRPARLIKIDAGATYTASITAGYPGLRQLAFPSGSYRLVLLYTTSASALPSEGNSVMITSPTFQVQ